MKTYRDRLIWKLCVIPVLIVIMFPLALVLDLPPAAVAPAGFGFLILVGGLGYVWLESYDDWARYKDAGANLDPASLAGAMTQEYCVVFSDSSQPLARVLQKEGSSAPAAAPSYSDPRPWSEVLEWDKDLKERWN